MTSNIAGRVQINDTKAGMQNIDKDRINEIIMKHTLNSKYYKKQQAKEADNQKRIDTKLSLYERMKPDEINQAEVEADAYLARLMQRRDLSRTLVHIDMDAFYASVEMRDDPSLKEKPMAVGSNSMLSTSNYLARKYGVRAAMPGFIAKELCPQLLIVPCNFDKYRLESSKIMKIIALYDANYSAMSLDEAYLDLTEYLPKRLTFEESKRTFQKNLENDGEVILFGFDAEECVREIRHLIYLTTGLTASAGIACNLRLAKLCSDINKPNGQYFLPKDEETIEKFIRNMAVRKINGIGPTSFQTLQAYAIATCEDLYRKRAMIRLLETQNTFEFLMHVCIGLGMNFIEHEENKKSIGHETTFSNASSSQELIEICKELSEEVSQELVSDNLEAQKVTLKIKTVEFEVYTRTKTLKAHTRDANEIYNAAKDLLMNEMKLRNNKLKLRLIGVRVSDLKDINDNTNAKKKTNLRETENLMRIDKFLKKKLKNDDGESNLSRDNEDLKIVAVINDCCDINEDFSMKETFICKCPFCDDLLEGNREFIDQHAEFCINFNR